MGFDDRAADCQPHAHSTGTRAEVRVKYLPHSLRLDTLSIISHAKLNTARCQFSRFL